MKGLMVKYFVPVIFLSAVLVLESAAATVRVWSGVNLLSGNWTSAINWDGGVAPLPGDTLLFPDDGLRRTSNTNNYPAGTTFSAITFGGTGYRLRGNAVTISNSVNAALNSGTNIIDLNIEAGQFALTVQVFAATDFLTFNGDIDLNARTLLTSGPGDIRITGVISGAGGVFKNNGGDLRMDGEGANTYTGSTTVNAGILRLGRYVIRGLGLAGAVAVPGDLFIGSGTGGLIGDVVALERDHQIANTSDVRVNGSGSLELSDENDTIGSLTLTAGTVLTGAGILTLNGHVFANTAAEDSVIAGNLDLGTNTACRFDVDQGAQLNIPARISGDASTVLIKTNRGDMFLSASNIFDGPVQVEGGSITVAHGAALGTPLGNTRLFLGVLNIHDVGVFGEELDVQGPSATLGMDASSAAWNGPVILNDDLLITVPTNRNITITGRISGPAGFTKFGDGSLTLKTTYTNEFNGAALVTRGGVVLDGVFNQTVLSGPLTIGNTNIALPQQRVHHIKHHQIADNVPVTIRDTGILQPGGFDDVVGSITGAGALDLGSGAFATGADNTSTTFAGEISGSGGVLEKVGAGVWTLDGTSTWSGMTLVSAGGLIVNGMQRGSHVLVAAGASLGGAGTVGSVTNATGGLIAPSGTLTCSNAILRAGSTYHVDLNGPIGYDQLNARGRVSLTNAILTGVCSFTPPIGQTFVIIQNDGIDDVGGEFQGLPHGAVFALGGFAFRINYHGGTGNDVALIRIASPASDLSAWTTLPKGYFKFQGTGLPGLDYVVQAATNLNPVIQWLPLATNTVGASGLYEFIDVDAAAHPMRFYRAVAP